MIKQVAINRFLAIWYLYFQITEEPSEDVPAIEIQEWMNIINSVEDPSADLPYGVGYSRRKLLPSN